VAAPQNDSILGKITCGGTNKVSLKNRFTSYNYTVTALFNRTFLSILFMKNIIVFGSARYETEGV
ncbi:MAG: hypothetical protein RR214_04590, partial [Synergistaceae bacterium]